MKLKDLIAGLSIMKSNNATLSSIEITGIAEDSRLIQPGYLFVAIVGKETDGHDFISQAIEQGAVAIIGQRNLNNSNYPIPYLLSPNPRFDLSAIAARFYGFPSEKLKVIGITGTDGKTTTTSFIHSILSSARYRTSMITTLGAMVHGQFTDIGVHVTTPGAVQVQSFLSRMVARGEEYAVLEVTSHALDQARVRNCNFDVAVVTNVTHEHLNYHGTYEAYREAKSKLFYSLLSESVRKPDTPKVSILNKDDASYAHFSSIPTELKYSYSLDPDKGADFSALNIIQTPYFTSFVATTPEGPIDIRTSLIGKHNVSNALAAIAACYSQQIAFEFITEGIQKLHLVTARMQKIDCGQDFDVYVDYAHTPNALKNTLTTARDLSSRRVILVFGLSGGLRDTTKRPLMGEIAGTMADKIVITAVDWYTQDVGEILEEIAVGCENAHRIRNIDYWCVRDRKDGIELGINLAKPGDIVVVAGKGHENSISYGGIEQEWNEIEAVKSSIKAKSKFLGI